MLPEPKCYKRKCKYYLGVIQPDGTEVTEVNNCEAFPKGIPSNIVYGESLHTKKHPNQDNDIIFEKIEKQTIIIKREGK